jgi:O-succinylbenzoic acid--CoA ligase
MAPGKLPVVARLLAIDATGTPAFVDALRRAWDASDAVLPVDPRLAPPTRARLLEDLGDRPTQAGDALVVATSGTTGHSKGAILTHDAVAASATATSARLAVDPDRDHWLACLPLAHVGGLAVVTRALLTGTRLTVHDGFDAAAVESSPANLVSLVATALQRVDVSHYRRVVLGGSAPPTDVPANVVITYGMTETGSGIVYDGLPLDGVEVRIDPATHEVQVKGPMLLRAYRMADSDVPALLPDGWFATGDAGRFAADGRLLVDGRLSELIITGGENVWPQVVEDILRRHAAVADVAVVGQPDPEWGQRVVAFVVPTRADRPPTLDELRGLVKAELAAWHAPAELVLVDALPKTALGKVRRGALTRPGDHPR